MRIPVPTPSLVVLIGPSGSGKSTFAARHFGPTEVLSSDTFRGLVRDDPNDLSATDDAFEALRFIADRRLAAGRSTVVDATNVQPEDRLPLVELARSHHVPPVAIVFDLPGEVCRDRNAGRPDREVPPRVIGRQRSHLHASMAGLAGEGFAAVFVLTTPGEVDAVQIERRPLPSGQG